MKKFFKILSIIAAVAVVLVLGAVGYLLLFLPNVGDAPDLQVELTPERVQRGEYLANHVMVCMDCHSQRDFTQFSGPLKASTFGAGGEKFDHNEGFPGTFYSRNITPAALGDWTDGEIYRAITTGVSRDGHAFFPVMPYQYYAKADPEDIKDIIAYLRSLQPITNEIPASKPDFPFNLILRTIPQKAEPSQRPAITDQVAYGKYLANVAACYECHTNNDDKGQKLPGMDWAGGWEMSFGDGRVVRTSNLTPDMETGIGAWTEEAFLARFKAYADSTYRPHAVGGQEFQTIMPWLMYAGMKDEDLKAIFAYLRTVPPIKNKVEKFSFVPVAAK